MLALALCAPPDALEPPSPAPDTIVLGMSSVLSGPTANLGLSVRQGVEAAIRECNTQGGVHGTPLELVALDDGYEPSRTAPNMRRLVADPRTVAIVGNVGTPTAVVALPIAREAGILFYGAYTGAGLLRRDPPEHFVVNVRASYAQETAAMVDALVDKAGLRPEEIAFFTQRDSYGDAGFAGGIAALARHGLQDETAIAHGRYERNSTAIEDGLADVIAAATPVRAVILVGAYAPCAKFIRKAREIGLGALFLNVSFVGGESLAKELGDAGEGVIVTQVVPPPWSDLPAAVEYRRALTAYDAAAKPGFGSFEGYVLTRVLARALTSTEGTPTRRGLVDALEALGSFDLGLGTPLFLGPADHQASDAVWPTVVRSGELKSFAWEDLAAIANHLHTAVEVER
jgi:ABC-type branched-subunit amino acid transport system substrate-binding protein